MSNKTPEELVEASSLGTPEAKALRDSVSDEQAQRIVQMADGPLEAGEGEAYCFDCDKSFFMEDYIRMAREHHDQGHFVVIDFGTYERKGK